MKLKDPNLLSWAGRIFFISFLGMILTYNISIGKPFFNYFVILFSLNFSIIGVGFLRSKKDANFIASNVLAVSLILAGLVFSTVWIMVAMFGFPLDNQIVTTMGLIFMVSILGIMFGGLASK